VQVINGFPWDALAGIAADPVEDRVERRLAEALESPPSEPAPTLNRLGGKPSGIGDCHHD
jgi:hypothetical protein